MLNSFLELFLAIAFAVKLGEPSPHDMDFGYAVSERRVRRKSVFLFLFFAFSHYALNNCLVDHTGILLDNFLILLTIVVPLENSRGNRVSPLDHRCLYKLDYLKDLAFFALRALDTVILRLRPLRRILSLIIHGSLLLDFSVIFEVLFLLAEEFCSFFRLHLGGGLGYFWECLVLLRRDYAALHA